jgi:Heterokaryon incompatibility protein (HET)
MSQCRIKVDSQDFMITRNLYAALKGLRHPSTRRTLWIDAICINQADDRERNEQVKQMKDIYESAIGVIVWLGDAARDMDRISCFFDPSVEIHFDYYDHSVSIFYRLLCNPWWRRMWVIQELLVARKVTVQCGRYTVSWPRFCQLVSNIEERNFPYFDAEKMIRLRNEWQWKKFPQGLLRLAWDFRDKEASDARDKLYGLLGLLPQEDHLITPRYFDQVFKDFARAWINRYGSLLVANLARSGQWYPDWTDGPFKNKNEDIESFWDEGFNSRESYTLWHDKYSAAGGHPAPNCTHPFNRDILHLRGFIHDTIIKVAVQCGQPSIGATPDWQAYMKEWRNLASKVTGLAHASINEAFYLTITAGFFDSEPSAEQMAKYEVRDAACRYRRFFVTSKGAFGIGPGEMSEGDLICVLGARVPFILAKDGEYALDDEFEFVESPLRAAI